MFSLHIDTARTWRGGQSQVLITLMGLRALGHRTLLVAHSEGELRQRAKEGLDLVALAPKTEMDLTAAWRLSRIIKQLKPDIVHAHDPHGVAMAGLALSMTSRLVVTASSCSAMYGVVPMTAITVTTAASVALLP